MESLLEDGYSPTENIIILRTKKGDFVREGNRRISALKLIHGMVKGIDLPDHISDRIKALPKSWLIENATVPCAIYEESEKEQVERLVSRTHAKGEKAGRSAWNTVARARYGRDHNKQSEPGLDLLERFLDGNKNLSQQQIERWSGEYPLSVLDEALQKLTPLLGNKTSLELVKSYPKKHKKLLDEIATEVGLGTLQFKDLRATGHDWYVRFGVPKPAVLSSRGTTTSAGGGTMAGSSTIHGGASSTTSGSGATPTVRGTLALASNDPKSVRKALSAFKVHGARREKLVTLLGEIKGLQHEKHPHAFCFLLRSLFELSAKAYCSQYKTGPHAPKATKPDGSDRKLVEILRDIVKHLTNDKADKGMVKTLHGPMTELAKSDGLLSVTSLNQLVHNPSFSISPSDISILFGNIFPLLEEMNK